MWWCEFFLDEWHFEDELVEAALESQWISACRNDGVEKLNVDRSKHPDSSCT